MKHIIVTAFIIVLMLVTAGAINAQTVTIASVSPVTQCDTAQVTVSYTAVGAFGAKNVFTVQLSAADGSFSPYFQNAGSLKTSTSGTITITVPHGNKWRVRVASSTPYVVSADNGSDIVVPMSPPSGYFAWRSGDQPAYQRPNVAALVDDAVIFKADVINLSLHYSWNFGSDATPSTSTDTQVSVFFTNPGSKQVQLTVTDPITSCSRTTTQAAANIFSCNPSIPKTAGIDSVVFADSSQQRMWYRYDHVWVVPGGEIMLRQSVHTIYAEAGSNIRGGWSDTIYLRAGATYDGAGYQCVVIYEPGASIAQQGSNNIFLQCSSLSFDYTDAPPYKISWASSGVTPEAIATPNFSLYPNPATGIVTVEASETPTAITVCNALGATLWSDHPLSGKRVQFDVSHYPNGVYYVKLTTQGHTSTERFNVMK